MTHRLAYAVCALVALTRHGGPLTAKQISAAEGIPRPYLLSILRDLAVGGVLESRRGRNGGFTLARGPETLSVAEVADLLRGAPAPAETEEVVDSPLRRFPHLWAGADEAARQALAAVSIADLAAV